MYRLVAMDLDKTLVMPDGTVPDEVVRRLRGLRSEGVELAICTGRVRPSAEYYADLIGGASVVSFNGSFIRTDDGKILETCIPLALVKEVVDFCYSIGVYVQLYRGNTILIEKFTKELETDRDIHFTDYEELGDLSKAELCDSPKLIALELSDKVDECLEQMIERFPQLNITHSSRYVLEIMPRNISKAYGLEKVAECLGISREETVAIGDSMNDLSMIQWAGKGVAVGNADDDLKRNADIVTKNEMAYGVLEALDLLFGDQ